jgi:hypothetical protein
MGDDKLLARVGDRTLYASDLRDMFRGQPSPEDSVRLLESYVDMWAKKMLKVQEAERRFRSSEEEIESKVEEYRNSLLTFKLDQYYLDHYLDTAITESQIFDYHKANQERFPLESDLVKGVVVHLDARYRGRDRIKAMLASPTAENRRDVLEICLKNNFTMWEAIAWSDANEMASHIGLPLKIDLGKLIATRGVQEYSARNDLYYVAVTDALLRGQPSPFELPRVRETIRKVLINARRQEIVHRFEDSLLRMAVESNRAEINVK